VALDALGVASVIARRALPPGTAVTGLLMSGLAQAATINVDAVALVGETGFGNATCTLDSAIFNALNDFGEPGAPGNGRCEAGSGADTIVLPAGSTFTVSNAYAADGRSYARIIDSKITIEGNGATIQRSSAPGTPAFRFFDVIAGGELILRDLTLRNGQTGPFQDGGAILVRDGDLRLDSCTLTGNTAAGDGGAIHSQTSNLAGTDTYIINSTFSGNSAGDQGGAIHNYRGATRLISTTITGNTAGGAGSGVSSFPSAADTGTRVQTSIISGNAGNDDVDSDSVTNTFDPGYGNNLIGGGDATGAFTNSGITNPGLGPLADNGGPTPTHLPYSGSPAIDAAGYQSGAFDQRNAPGRIDGDGDGGAAPDIGAVEFIPPIIVDGNDVAVTANGSCSLLEAIVNANVTGTHADCEAGSATGPDSIVLAPNTVFGLTNDFGDSYGATGLPEFRSEILIQGNGAIIERSSAAAAEFRVLAVDATGDLTLEQATLRGGVVTGNNLQSDGGGFFNQGNLTLRRVTVTGNTGSVGGGGLTQNGGLLRVERSTISGNSANQAGGLHVVTGGTASLSNSTVSGNSAPVTGGITMFGSLGLTHSTIAGNSSYSLSNAGAGATTLTNSLVVGGPCYGAGANTLIGANIASDGSCSGFTIDGDAASLLGPLADNGGATQTHALQAGHPAIDVAAADAHCATTDQRGAVRPQDGDATGVAACDVGAFEVRDPIVVGNSCTLIDAINNANDSSDGQANIDCSAGDPYGHDTIVLPTDVVFTYNAYNNTVDGANALPSITSAITIQGNGTTVERSSAMGTPAFRLFHVAESGDLTLDQLTLRGGFAVGSGLGSFGGAIANRGRITLSDSTVSGNSAGADGGGIVSRNDLASQVTTLINSTVSGNSANSRGGGLFNVNGLSRVIFSTVTGNTAALAGSGIASFGDNVTRTEVRGSIVSGNAGNDDVAFVTQATNSFESLGDNLIGGGNATGTFAETGDQPGVTDLMLSALNDHGGATRTHLPVPGSAAVDAVQGVCGSDPATDQRGITRPQDGDNAGGALCDIGAAEIIDTDGDGLPDGYEDNNGLDSNSAVGVDSAGGDLDGDGRNNTEEFLAGTVADNPDSDDDGIGDGLDATPRTASNACVPMGGDVTFGSGPPILVAAGTVVQCAAPGQITVTGDLTIEIDGRAELFSGTASFQTGVSVPIGGQLRVRIGNPVPGNIPPP
jgi:predicted outer membrane repeat protein